MCYRKISVLLCYILRLKKGEKIGSSCMVPVSDDSELFGIWHGPPRQELSECRTPELTPQLKMHKIPHRPAAGPLVVAGPVAGPVSAVAFTVATQAGLRLESWLNKVLAFVWPETNGHSAVVCSVFHFYCHQCRLLWVDRLVSSLLCLRRVLLSSSRSFLGNITLLVLY